MMAQVSKMGRLVEDLRRQESGYLGILLKLLVCILLHMYIVIYIYMYTCTLYLQMYIHIVHVHVHVLVDACALLHSCYQNR